MSFVEKLINYRWKIFIVFSIVILLSGIGLKTTIIPDNSLQVWFLKSDPLLKDYRRFHDHFGNDEVILVAMNFKRNIFNKDDLNKIRVLVEKLKKQEGVDQVVSITNIQDVYDENDEIFFQNLVGADFEKYSKQKLKTIAKRAASNPMIHNRLVNADGTVAMLWVQMQSEIDSTRDAIVANVKQIVNVDSMDIDVHYGGVGIVYSALNLATTHDFGLFIILSYLVMIAFLWYAFKSTKMIVAAMSVISVGTVFTLGLYGLCGNHLNMVTVMLPTLVAILGIADAIHFPSAFVQIETLHPEFNKRDVAIAALKKVFMPCLMTTLTTMAGFLALVSSPMLVIQQLGYYAAWGIGISLISSLLFMILAYLSMHETASLPKDKFIDKILTRILDDLKLSKLWIKLVCFVVVLVGLLGIPKLNIDTYTIGYLPDKDQAVVDHKKIEKIWGNYNVLELMVHPLDNLKADDVRIINATEKFISEVSQLPEVRHGLSLADVYRRIERVFRSGPPPKGPMQSDTFSQIKLIVDSGVNVWDRKAPNFNENIVAPFLNKDSSIGRITFVAEMLSAKEIDRVLKKIDSIAQKYFSELANVKPSGYVPLYVKIIEYILSSQIKSLFIAIGTIFLLMFIWLKSFRLALIGIIPNIFPIIIMFGLMGHFGIHLDIATATIAAIIMGVSIDDTIHFLYYWAKAEKDGRSYVDCLDFTFHSCGRAAITTSVLLFLGYSVMMFADVKSVVSFGGLTSVSAILAIVGDLLLLPLLLKLGFPNKKI